MKAEAIDTRFKDVSALTSTRWIGLTYYIGENFFSRHRATLNVLKGVLT